MIDDSATPARSTQLTRDAAALITSVDPSMTDVLGWEPEQLIGQASTDLIHPEDQGSGVAAWFAMLAAPGEIQAWRGRYKCRDGTWRWVETFNVSYLDDPARGYVASTMTLIGAEEKTIEEELRSREQLISRLSDALPIGLFQIDDRGNITFTNDRLHTILDTPPAATVAAQFASVVPDDQCRLDAVLDAVLADQAVDDIEVRLHLPPVADGTDAGERVCVLALRPLTDSTGEVNGAIGCLSDVTEQVQLRRQLEVRASTDGLTSCWNRASTLELLDRTLSHQTPQHPTALIFVDLDQFKAINDRFGHAAGDRVLETVAARLAHAVREQDQVGRIGGDEFLVICPGVDSERTAAALERRLSDALNGAVQLDGHLIPFTASTGGAWTDTDIDPDSFVAQADRAMYDSKRSQEGTVEDRPGRWRRCPPGPDGRIDTGPRSFHSPSR